MSFNIRPGQDPNAYAQHYAKLNGISFEDAKTELKAKYGDPVKPNDSSIFNEYQNKSAKDPETKLTEYMEETGKSEADAKADLEAQYGRPKQEGKENDFSAFLTQFINGLMNLFHIAGGSDDGPQNEGDPNPSGEGVSGPSKTGDPDPKKDDPDVAAQKYADDHGVTLEEAREALKELYGEAEAKV